LYIRIFQREALDAGKESLRAKSILTQSRLGAALLLKEHAATKPLPIRA